MKYKLILTPDDGSTVCTGEGHTLADAIMQLDMECLRVQGDIISEDSLFYDVLTSALNSPEKNHCSSRLDMSDMDGNFKLQVICPATSKLCDR